MLGTIVSALESALPAIASGLVIGLVGWVINAIKKSKFSITKFMEEHQKLVEYQDENYKDIKKLKKDVGELKDENKDIKQVMRNDTKSHIVSLYERYSERGSITPMGLETVNRLDDSYHNILDGNTYIGTIVGKMNKDLPVKGEEIPEH